MNRSVPPSPRRLALARRAGLLPRSRVLVAGGAWIGAALALYLAASRASAALRDAMRTAAAGTPTLAPPGTATAVLGIAAPLLVGVALGAVGVHVAQTRTLVAPRRRVAGAPHPARGVDRRLGDAGLAAGRAALVAAVALVWLGLHLADLGDLALVAAPDALAGAGALGASLVAHLAGAFVVGGALDLGVAVIRHRADLMMTREEAAEDARAAGVDSRWPRRRGAPAAMVDAGAIRTAAVVITGDGAIAVRYHPRVWPRPTVVAVGRGLDAERITALARRHRVAVHHAPLLARAIAVANVGDPVPEAARPALAEVIAAVDTNV